MKLIKTLIITIFFILAITFALQNQQPMTLHYYGLIPDFSVPVFLLVFLSVLLGILIGGFGDLFLRYSLRMRARKCEKELKRVKEELTSVKQRVEAKEAEESEKPGEQALPAPREAEGVSSAEKGEAASAASPPTEGK